MWLCTDKGTRVVVAINLSQHVNDPRDFAGPPYSVAEMVFDECECQTCGGDGSVSGSATICSSCIGTGRKIVTKRIAIGCTGFSSHYLTMLKELPGMKLAPTEPEKGNYFKWDDGDGLYVKQ
jgi:hypothetical protein